MQEKVLQRMSDLGLNTSSLAKRMGKYQSTLRGFISGETKTFRDIKGLAKALETTPDWLLSESTTPNERSDKIQKQAAISLAAACLVAFIQLEKSGQIKGASPAAIEKAVHYFYDDFIEGNPPKSEQIKRFILLEYKKA